MQNKDKTKRPSATMPQFHNVPEELQAAQQWVLWRYDWQEGRGEWAKVPYRVDGHHAKSNDPSTWATFKACVSAFNVARSSYDGIGFVFNIDSPYVGVDLDLCVTHDQQNGDYLLTPFAARAVERLSSYTELSPSRTGLHIIGRAGDIKAMKSEWHGNAIEVYRTGRYFTFTGLSWQESVLPVRDIHGELEQMLEKIRAAKQSGNGNGHTGKAASMAIEKRLELALRQSETARLFNGETADYAGDDSRADLALCGKLARFADGSAQILDAMFRQSKLMRGKWDEARGEQTYGEMTVAKALDGKSDFLARKSALTRPESTADTRRAYRFGVDDLWESAMAFRKNPLNRGVHPGWDELEPYYRPRAGLFTVITGDPGSGKSTFFDVMSYKIACRHNWKICYASFETLPIERHILDLCQIHLQRPTFTFCDYAATDEEMEQARDEIRKWFRFIGPQDHEMTVESILEYVEDEIREEQISGFVLDPWSEVEEDASRQLAQTMVIERDLRKLRNFTRHHKIHTWLIAHPSKSGDTYRENRPTLRSITGSRHFENKADYGLVVGANDDDTTTLYVDKVRFSETGKRNQKVNFRFDASERMFYPAGLRVIEEDEEELIRL